MFQLPDPLLIRDQRLPGLLRFELIDPAAHRSLAHILVAADLRYAQVIVHHHPGDACSAGIACSGGIAVLSVIVAWHGHCSPCTGFADTGFAPSERLPVARRLGETSPKLPGHRSLDHDDMADMVEVREGVLQRAMRIPSDAH